MRNRCHLAIAVSLAAAFAAGPAAGSQANDLDPGCGQKLAATGAPANFADVVDTLPAMAKKTPYESMADYERRLAAASRTSSAALLLVRKPTRVGEGLSYDAERRILKIYPTAFGAGAINFTMIFGMAPRGQDAFASAVAFSLEATEESKESYEATNGFGAKVMITRTTRRVHALWERHGKRGESQFAGKNAFTPLAEILIAPDLARDVIERGTIAFLAVPTPPFKATGVDGVAPDFQRPRERLDNVTALIADVQCAYVRQSDGTAIAAFAVR